jgi:DNA mismatch repair protein MutS2
MDDIFKNLARMEQDLSMREKEIAETRERLEGMVGEYDGGLKDLNRRRDELGSQFQQDFTELMADFRSRLEGCIRQLREEAGSRDSVQAARDEMVRVEKDFRQFTEDLQEKGRDEDRVRLEPATEDLAPGDRVSVSTTHGDAVEGKVIGLKDGKVTLMAGSLKLTADLNRVRKILPGHGGGPGRGPERGVQRRSWDFTPAQDRPKVTECDIRGMRYEEAMEELERFIDNAVLNNLGMVHVIHGLGTGALREGVQENLKKNRFVARMEYARPEQGGFGCTIVTLKS